MDFEEFDFHPSVAAGVAAAGFKNPTPIQARSIPVAMEGRDIMGLAQTGTGKTAAFALPLLERLLKSKRGGVRALILAPTRELAEQIHQAIQDLGRKTRIKSAAIYGGVKIGPQIGALKQADIVVACPGRLLDHIGRKSIDLSRLEALVVDEADRMFDMGFLPDIRRIMKHLPENRQTMLFSATMPKEIRRFANDILRDPKVVEVGLVAPAETVSHALYPVAAHLKTALLLKLLESAHAESVLVFTRTKHRARTLDKKLSAAGYRSASLQGNLSQNRRREAMDGFREGKFQILVATDIASRGIDVTRISHVINYDIPSTPEDYIHRIGRTGRAYRDGEALTLVTAEDSKQVRAINRTIGSDIEQRTLSSFDYGTSAPRSEKPSQRKRKPQHKFSGFQKKAPKNKPYSRSFA